MLREKKTKNKVLGHSPTLKCKEEKEETMKKTQHEGPAK